LLTREQSERYQRDGYVLLAGRFTLVEVHDWVSECERLWQELSDDLRADRIQYRGGIAGGRVADRIDPVVDISPAFGRLAADPRIVDAATALLGAPAALMKAKLITKRPGTMGYLPHQDFPYWEHLGIGADAMLSVQVSIDRATPDNGALEVYPGLQRTRLPAPPGAPLDTDVRALEAHSSEVVASEPGDLLFFHSMTPHRSGPNRAGHPRRTLYLTYVGGVGAEIYEQYRMSAAVRG
jgi:hypothetical protein